MAATILLKDLCTIDITDGTHKTPTYADEGYIFLSSKNVTSGVIDWENVMYIPESLHNELYKRIAPQKNDILLAKNGTTGVAAIVDRDEVFDIYVSLALIRPDVSKVLPKYLLHAINSYPTKRFFDSHLKGIGVPNLHLTHIRETPIRVPSISEQQYITDVLDKIDELIALRKEQLAMLGRLVSSRFIELFGTIHDNKFGFNIVTLQDVSAPIKDGTPQTPTYTDDTENGYKFLSSKDVTTGKIDWSHLKYIPEELHQELYARIAPRKGDILLAKNGTTGIAAVVDRDEVFDIYVSLALIRPIGIHTTYLWAAINAAETKQQFDASLKGIGVPNLHLGEIKKARIILPPMALQEQFAVFVEQTDKSKLAIQQSLDKLELLKKSLMQEYFG